MRNGLMPFPQMAQAAGAVRYDPTIGRFVPVDQFVDSRFRVTGSVDPTKRVALEVDTNVPTRTTVTLTVPERSIGLQAEAEEKSASFTAALHGVYVITATCTVTDPTPAQGHEFICFIRNGTATIGGTAYDQPGTMVWRSYHSGAWSNAVLPAISGAYTWTGQQTFTQPILLPDGTAALPALARSAAPSTGISFSGGVTVVSSSGTTALQVQNAQVNQFAFATHSAYIGRRANTSEAAPSQVLSGERVAEFRGGGYHDGGAYDTDVGGLRLTARENYTSTATGTSLELVTTAIGSTGAGVRWRINPTGELVRGDTDALGTFSPSGTAISPWLQVIGTTAATASLGFARFSNDGSPPQHIGAKSRGTSVGTYTATSSGDDLLRIGAQGVDTTATAFREAAAILFEQDAAGGASAVPGRVSIHTATSGGTVTEALRVDSGQGVQIRSSMSTTSPGAGQTLTRGLQVDEQTITTTGAIAALASDTGVLRLTGAAPDVQGITAPTLGDRILIMWATNATTLRHENAGASAANRITCSTGADITLAAGRSIMLWYDSTSTRWRNLAQAA